MSSLKDALHAAADHHSQVITELSDDLYAHPELGHQEFHAQKQLTATLKQAGYIIEAPYGGLPTAFRATLSTGRPGPTVALLAEYDALPDIGHGCGHNVIGAASVGAALALASCRDKLAGTIVCVGTPAEETDGGKVTLTERGAFDTVDFALMVHPSDRHCLGRTTLALDALEFVFSGRPAHAAGAPHEGINALDACIQTFNGISALRQHLTDDVRIHGIIVEGGVAPNIVPERAVARFYVRARQRGYLNTVVEKVKACARAGATAAGAKVEIRNFELSNDNIKLNHRFTKLYSEQLAYLGITDVDPVDYGSGSSDLGNVSQRIPAIHPYVAICDHPIPGHTREFGEATTTPTGHVGLLAGAKALAMTAAELLTSPEVAQEVKNEFLRK